jgi:hypothetical protein
MRAFVWLVVGCVLGAYARHWFSARRVVEPLYWPDDAEQRRTVRYW